MCDGNKEQAIENDIRGMTELPTLETTVSRWHLFFTEKKISDTWLKIMLETPPKKLRKLGYDTLVEQIPKHIIIPSSWTDVRREEYIRD